MEERNEHSGIIRPALEAAAPIMLGYVAIGIPCGLLGIKSGLELWMIFLMSCTFYSGVGQFMIPNLLMAGTPLASIILSVAFVNTRQMLYSASFAPYMSKVSKSLSFLFAATVTDESFGVNLDRYNSGEPWDARKATLVNIFSMSSWTISNVVGALIGEAITMPIAIASFAMTSIFICLFMGQPKNRTNLVVAAFTVIGVVVFKSIGLSGPAILFGALTGIAAGVVSDAVMGS
ncbi:MAG: AzlC family ABC transporter permease [Atopobiaceae bacterium]|nr:AzlC family ABC transporter permease [Atopobiaceae bacterium]